MNTFYSLEIKQLPLLLRLLSKTNSCTERANTITLAPHSYFPAPRLNFNSSFSLPAHQQPQQNQGESAGFWCAVLRAHTCEIPVPLHTQQARRLLMWLTKTKRDCDDYDGKHALARIEFYNNPSEMRARSYAVNFCTLHNGPYFYEWVLKPRISLTRKWEALSQYEWKRLFYVVFFLQVHRIIRILLKNTNKISK